MTLVLILAGLALAFFLGTLVNRTKSPTRSPTQAHTSATQSHPLPVRQPESTPLPRAPPSSAPQTTAIREAQEHPQIAQPDLYARPLDLLTRGRANIFLTGRAGTGKSTLLRRAFGNRRIGVVTVAPTGVAALNVGGETIHRFFAFPTHYLQEQDVKYRRSEEFWRNLSAMVIDEISMVRADTMNAIDLSLRMNRRSHEPFGGVKIVVVGDLGQLPPVVKQEIQQPLLDQFNGKYFDCCPGVAETNWKIIELRHVFRQADAAFVALLDAIRVGEVSDPALAELNTRVGSASDAPGIILTTSNNRAREINSDQLSLIEEREHTFTATIEGMYTEGEHPTDQHLTLKVGARVMILRNDPDGNWVNGTICDVTRIDAQSVWVRIGTREFELGRATWEKFTHEYDPVQKAVKPKVVATFRQIPLRLAWAVTIHKSQGLSFDAVHVDLPNAPWDHGQLYVALSRCRSLEGLTLSRPISRTDIIVDDAAFRFLKDVAINEQGGWALGERETRLLS